MAVLAAYRKEPTVTVRDLAARFGVGKSTIALWLKEAGLSRQRGARLGAPMTSRLVVEDDFKAVLLDWYGSGIWRHARTVLNKQKADNADEDNAFDYLNEWSQGFAISSPSAAALIERFFGKPWDAIAMELLLERVTTMTRAEWFDTFGEDYPDEVRHSPALARRAAREADDLRLKVRRRLDALSTDPTFTTAVATFELFYKGDKPPEWMTAPAVTPRCNEHANPDNGCDACTPRCNEHANPEQGCAACDGLTQTGLDNRTK
jgi:transcriptional regulator with XRE-family HTH domain